MSSQMPLFGAATATPVCAPPSSNLRDRGRRGHRKTTASSPPVAEADDRKRGARRSGSWIVPSRKKASGGDRRSHPMPLKDIESRHRTKHHVACRPLANHLFVIAGENACGSRACGQQKRTRIDPLARDASSLSAPPSAVPDEAGLDPTVQDHRGSSARFGTGSVRRVVEEETTAASDSGEVEEVGVASAPHRLLFMIRDAISFAPSIFRRDLLARTATHRRS